VTAPTSPTRGVNAVSSTAPTKPKALPTATQRSGDAKQVAMEATPDSTEKPIRPTNAKMSHIAI
jgi:hypothetical protein